MRKVGSVMKYLKFQLNNESYGIPIEYVRELIGLMDYTEVPKMPNYYKGIMNLRGKIVSLIDLRKRFVMIEKEYDNRTSVIVVDMQNSTYSRHGNDRSTCLLKYVTSSFPHN